MSPHEGVLITGWAKVRDRWASFASPFYGTNNMISRSQALLDVQEGKYESVLFIDTPSGAWQ
jgi:hypothetical protein